MTEPIAEQARLTEAESDALTHAIMSDDRLGGDRSTFRAVERIVTQRVAANADYHLAMHQAYRPEVVAEVAVHLGSHEDWDRLVEWTGGRIEPSQDPSGEYTSMLVLPNGEVGGDWAWLVLNHAGEFHFRAEVQPPDALTRPATATISPPTAGCGAGEPTPLWSPRRAPRRRRLARCVRRVTTGSHRKSRCLRRWSHDRTHQAVRSVLGALQPVVLRIVQSPAVSRTTAPKCQHTARQAHVTTARARLALAAVAFTVAALCAASLLIR